MNLIEQLEKRRALLLAAVSSIDQTLAAFAALAAPQPAPQALVSSSDPKSQDANLFTGGHGDPA
jgi:copper(I)-binding protein